MKDGRDKNYVRCKIEGTRTLLDERWKGQKLCSMKDRRDKTLFDERWKGQELCSMEDERYKNSVHGIKEKK